jgi:hypothetical protein
LGKWRVSESNRLVLHQKQRCHPTASL